MAEYNINAIGHVSLTIGLTPTAILPVRAMDGKGHVTFTASGAPAYLRPRHAQIFVNGYPVRWAADGVPPDGAIGMGMYVAANTYINWTDPLTDFSQLLANVQFVRDQTATGTPVLDIVFFN